MGSQPIRLGDQFPETEMSERGDLEIYQRTALKFPCYFASETAHPRFGHSLEHGCSLVLSVNSGYE